MDEGMELWLLRTVTKFREILDTKDYLSYKQLFPAFRSDLTYLNVRLVEVRFDDYLSSYNLEFYEGLNGDKVELYFLNLQAYSNDMNLTDKEFVDYSNDQLIENTYIKPTSFDEDGNVEDFNSFYPLQNITLPINFESLNISEFVTDYIDKKILNHFKSLKPEPIKEIDENLYKKAIEIAKKCVSEDDRLHPKVAAILLKNNQIIETAFRGELSPGEHAEYTLLKKKIKPYFDYTNTTLITTLEPCTVRGTPKTPCADYIKECGIKYVIIGMIDPNPEITEKGILYLQMNGISVNIFPHNYVEELIELNKDFYEYETRKYQKDIMKKHL